MTRISWQTQLDCTQSGPRSSLQNAVKVLRLDPIWRSERLWYDEFLDRVLIANSPAREWNDRDDSRVALYMQEQVGMLTASSTLVREAVHVVADERTRHCVRDWLVGLEWDGIERIALALEDHWGAQIMDGQPSDYVRAASENFFIGMIARVFQPGCQLDTMIVFEGSEGINKSSSLRILGGEWQSTGHESVQTKDFFEVLRGKWLIEISEMDAFSRAEQTRIKSVISTPVDRYRPSYGRSARDYPRQCVFVGTTNKDEWGNDETGLRRYWPIRCGAINLESLKLAREQMFAEAVSKYKAGAKWWEMPGSAKDVQADRQSQDVWTQDVVEWTDASPRKTEITIADVLKNAIKKDVEKRGKLDEMRIARVLTLNGWKKHREMRNGCRAMIWARQNEEVF